MTSLHFFFGIFLISLLGMCGIFVIRHFRLKEEKSLQLKLAIKNSEKTSVEEDEKQLQEKDTKLKKRHSKSPEKINQKEKKKLKKNEEEQKVIEEKKEEIKSQVSEKDFSTLLAKADMHISRKEFADAEKILIEVLSFDGDYIPAIEKLGHIYLETQSFSKSKLLYERLAEEYPKNPNVHTNHALSLFHEKEFEKAVEAYEKAKNLDSDNALRHANLGKVFFALRNYPVATEYFLEAIRRDPRNLEYHFLMADTFKTEKRLGEAKKWYQKILDLSPYDTEAKKEIEKFEALGF